MRVLDLFSGIGGIALGLHRAGMQTVGFCEIDPYCRRVLAKHWPGVWIHDDVRTLTRELVAERCGSVDLIAGGFPCQDVSNAGKRIGIEGPSSGLWREYARLICDIRPSYVVVENVPGLLTNGLDRVLSDLAACGFDAEWQVLPGGSFGAPFVRERVFVVAYPHGQHGRTRRPWRHTGNAPWLLVPGKSRKSADAAATGIGHWADEPGLDRLVCGVPPALDRLRGVGNAVVPAVSEYIGRLILEAIQTKETA